MVKRILAVFVALLLSVPCARADAVVVGSKLDTEGGILGSIILQMLTAKGIRTVDRTQLGATAIVRRALIEGQIDIYPEYTGNAAFFFGRPDLPVWKDAGAAYETARTLDLKANDLVWLAPASSRPTACGR
jgi:osmoprotectant transport system substrate-binding protein